MWCGLCLALHIMFTMFGSIYIVNGNRDVQQGQWTSRLSVLLRISKCGTCSVLLINNACCLLAALYAFMSHRLSSHVTVEHKIMNERRKKKTAMEYYSCEAAPWSSNQSNFSQAAVNEPDEEEELSVSPCNSLCWCTAFTI